MVNRRVRILGASLISSVVLVAVVYVIAVASGFAEDISRAGQIRYRIGLDEYYGLGKLPSMEKMIMWSDLIAVVNLESVSRGVERFTRLRSRDPGLGMDTFFCIDGYSMTLDYTFEVEQYLKGAGEDRIVATVIGDGSAAGFARTPVGALLFVRPDKHRNTTWDDRKAIVFLKDRGYDSSLIWKPGRYFLAHTNKYDHGYTVASPVYRAWLPAVSESADEQTFLLESDQGETSPRTITLDEIKGMVSMLRHRESQETFPSSLPEC